MKLENHMKSFFFLKMSTKLLRKNQITNKNWEAVTKVISSVVNMNQSFEAIRQIASWGVFTDVLYVKQANYSTLINTGKVLSLGTKTQKI